MDPKWAPSLSLYLFSLSLSVSLSLGVRARFPVSRFLFSRDNFKIPRNCDDLSLLSAAGIQLSAPWRRSSRRKIILRLRFPTWVLQPGSSSWWRPLMIIQKSPNSRSRSSNSRRGTHTRLLLSYIVVVVVVWELLENVAKTGANSLSLLASAATAAATNNRVAASSVDFFSLSLSLAAFLDNWCDLASERGRSLLLELQNLFHTRPKKKKNKNKNKTKKARTAHK